LLASLAVAAPGRAQSLLPLDLHRLSRKFFAVAGDGANMLATYGSEGIVLVDNGLAEQGPRLAATLQERIAQFPIRMVINTHWHYDHVGGNEALGAAGTEILAHANTKRRLAQRTTIEFLQRTFEPLKPTGLPHKTFTKPRRMEFGKMVMEIEPLPPAHTDGDVFVFFPNENILHTGDVLSEGSYPTIDYSTGGWIGGMAAASTRLLKVADANTKIVPGHGKVCTRAELAASHQMLSTVADRLQTLAARGTPVEEVVANRPTRDFDETWGKGLAPELFTRMAYESILRRASDRPHR